MSTEEILKLLFCIFLAFVPAIAWGIIFYKKHPKSKKMILATFIGGCFTVVPILLYQMSLERELDMMFFTIRFRDMLDFFGNIKEKNFYKSVVLTYMFVGVLEEFFKHSIVKIMDDDKIESVDDAIELSIVAALGFAFVENIMYFFNIWNTAGNINALFVPFIFRSVFSTFAHILFSGVFGYYYGVAHFAHPFLQAEEKEGKHPVIKFVHKVLHLKKDTLYHEEKIMEGLLLAILLHAGFNFSLEVGWIFVLVPYLFLGFYFLSQLLERKENHVRYKMVTEVRTSVIGS